MTASALEFGVAQGLTFSITNDCNSAISGTRCFKLGQRDDKVRTTIAPSDLVLSFSCEFRNELRGLTTMKMSTYIGLASVGSWLCCVNTVDSSPDKGEISPAPSPKYGRRRV